MRRRALSVQAAYGLYVLSADGSAVPMPLGERPRPANLPENGLIALGRSGADAGLAPLGAIVASLPDGLYATAGARECLALAGSAGLQFGYAGMHRSGPEEPGIDIWQIVANASAHPQLRRIEQEACLAVLPFRAPGRYAPMHGRAETLADDIRLYLTRFRDLRVLGSDTVRAWRASSLSAREVGRRLGVRHVLDGTLREAGNLVRIDSALIEVPSGRAVWAERYFRQPETLYDLTDEIAENIAAAVAGLLNERATPEGPPTPEDGRAFDLVLQGRAQLALNTADGLKAAAGLAQAALDLDPGCAPASVLAARCALQGWMAEDTTSASTLLAQAQAHANRALAADPFAAHGRLVLAQVLLAQARFDEAEAAFEAAMRLNPADATVLAEAAAGLGQLGRAEDGLARLRDAMALNPYFPDRYLAIMARLHLIVKQYDEALRAIWRMQSQETARPELVAALALSARKSKAQTEAARLLKEIPDFTIAAWAGLAPYRDAAHADRLREALLKAGLS